MSIANHDQMADPSLRQPVRAGGAALVVENLRVDAPDGKPIVEDVSFELQPSTILGIVGESGSGKTTTALALLGYTQGGARISRGTVTIGGERLPFGDMQALRRLRGSNISYVPQNPGTALNPSSRIGDAITEMIRAHREGDSQPTSVAEAFERVGLPGADDFQSRYPHQLSGGQQQRVCISVSLVAEPPVVVLDEPTTGLDVVTQARILEELVRLCKEQGLAMVYVTHDLAVVAQISDRIAVMYGGSIVEEGPARQVLGEPKHPYTRGLLRSIPDHLRPGSLEPMPGVAMGVDDRPEGCRFAPRCSLSIEACTTAVPDLLDVAHAAHRARCIRVDQIERLRGDTASVSSPAAKVAENPHIPMLEVSHLRAEHRSRHEIVVAAEDVNFTVGRGECVALVGESGSGKTTIARTIAGLHPVAGGTVSLEGETLPATAGKRSMEQRRRVQIIFQNPADALNPRQTIGVAVSRPARLLRGLGKKAADAEVTRLLDLVRLPQHFARRYPADLSGGEKQRVGIARAIAADPAVIVCDEITSALDVSVQAAVLALLGDLQREFGLALLFITHDLGVVANIADEVLVLDKGRVCEQGRTLDVLQKPAEGYTKRLLEAAPSVSYAIDAWEAEPVD
jgi:peptide/nickel transport system ATP-binding protein